MPNRIIKESIKTSNEIDALSWFEEVLFYRLIVSADDFGRYDGRAKILKNTLFPTKDDVTVKNVEKALCTLEESGLVHGYQVDGVPILQISKWEKHQQTRAKNSKYPSPEEADTAHADNLISSDIICNQMISDAGNLQANVPDIRNRESNTRIDTRYTESVMDAWNTLADEVGLQKIISLNDKRRKKIRSRLKEHGVDCVLSAITKIKESDFLQGKSDRGWRITFDWLLEPDHFQKVIEGNYANRKEALNGNGATEGWGQIADSDWGYTTVGNSPEGDTVFDGSG